MSSFVVSKKEFVKAAGLMYGIESAKSHPHRYFLENVLNNFVKCYELNVDSVNEQYNANDGKDEASYESTFDKYRKIGLDISYNAVLFSELRPRLMNFFNSVLYQIENDDMHTFVASFFYECTVKLFSYEIVNVEGWWGEIEL